MPGKRGKNSKTEPRRIIAIDAETESFEIGRVTEPLIWGAYDGDDFETFTITADFVHWLAEQRAVVYAHNGGKFDFMFLLPYIADMLEQDPTALPVRIINGRPVEIPFGKAVLRDSVAILPVALSAYQKDDFDYSILEKGTWLNHYDDVVTYLKSDCVNLFDLVSRFRTEAGSKLTIAGNALAFSQELNINVGRTNRYFDERFRPYYHGGRCEAAKPGHTKGGVQIVDIKSAYPYAMNHAHPVGSRYFDFRSHWTTLKRSQMQRAFFTVECWNEGAFPLRETDGLHFPHAYGIYHVTGWEFVVALDHGLISDLTVHHCFVFDDSITFTDYVDHWFRKKAEADEQGDKAQRLIAKIMLNSLYGKLCQDPTRYAEYRIVPWGSTPDWENGWMDAAAGDWFDVHKKPMLHAYQEQWGEDWKKKPLYHNVATGASITGFARAMLLDARERVGRENVLYMDTDSLVVTPAARLDQLDRGGNIGSWELEDEADEIFIAGKKLYATFTDGIGTKKACKGANLSMEQIRSLVVDGGAIDWQKDAPTFDYCGGFKFLRREIRATG